MDKQDKKGRGGSRPGNPNGNRGGSRQGAGPKPDLVIKMQDVRRLFSAHLHKFDAAEREAYRAELAAALAEVQLLQPLDEEWWGEIL